MAQEPSWCACTLHTPSACTAHTCGRAAHSLTHVQIRIVLAAGGTQTRAFPHTHTYTRKHARARTHTHTHIHTHTAFIFVQSAATLTRSQSRPCRRVNSSTVSGLPVPPPLPPPAAPPTHNDTDRKAPSTLPLHLTKKTPFLLFSSSLSPISLYVPSGLSNTISCSTNNIVMAAQGLVSSSDHIESTSLHDNVEQYAAL